VAQLVFLNPEKSGTALGVAKAYAVLIIPFSVVGPLSGVFIDRWPRRGILALTPLVRALAILALLPATGSSLYLYGPALVVISLDQFLIGVVTVLSVVVFKERFRQSVGSFGNIVAAGGVGVLAGTLTAGWLESRMSKPRMVAASFALAGVVACSFAPAITGPTILLVSFALGLTFAWRKVSADTL